MDPALTTVLFIGVVCVAVLLYINHVESRGDKK